MGLAKCQQTVRHAQSIRRESRARAKIGIDTTQHSTELTELIKEDLQPFPRSFEVLPDWRHAVDVESHVRLIMWQGYSSALFYHGSRKAGGLRRRRIMNAIDVEARKPGSIRLFFLSCESEVILITLLVLGISLNAYGNINKDRG